MADIRKKILVVDDDPAAIEFVSAVVQDLGVYDVESAENGQQAIDVARRELPALIVMDVNMPEKDGYTAFTELHQDPATSGIPVIMLSSLASFGEYVTMNPDILRPKLFLDKPIDPGKLADMIRRVLA